MNHSLGLLIESVVAILLVVTIAYCLVLNRRLRRLKADEAALKATIAELLTATTTAERAIGTLKTTVQECSQGLGERLRAAERASAELARQIAAGDELAKRMPPTEDAPAARPAPLDVKATLAAAQAFAARVSGAAA